MKFVCLGYIDESLWENLPEDRRLVLMNECFDYDDVLRRGGHFTGGEALGASKDAVTLQFQDQRVTITDGPFAETKEALGGILLLEARDMKHAIELMSRHPGVKMGPFEIRPSAPEVNELICARDAAVDAEKAGPSTAAADEKEIRRLIAAWTKALEARDAAGLTADYAPDAVLYDAIPPYKTVGAENIRKLWESCLPYFPESFKSVHQDLNVHVAGDVAIVHGLHHFVPTPADHPSGQTWMRLTVGYRRINGKWKVIHEHVSIPFNPMNNQAWFITDPAKHDMSDYGDPNACPTEAKS